MNFLGYLMDFMLIGSFGQLGLLKNVTVLFGLFFEMLTKKLSLAIDPNEILARGFLGNIAEEKSQI